MSISPRSSSRLLALVAAALIAASVLSAPLMIGGASSASAATTRAATPAKHGVKAVKKHHRHVVVRHGKRYVKVIRHGKAVYLKVKPRRHYAVHGKKPARHGTKIVRPRAA